MSRSVFYLLCGTWLFINEVDGQHKKIVAPREQVLEGGEYLALYKLALDYIDKDNKMALDFIQKAEDAALLSGDSLAIVKTTRTKGQILVRTGRFDALITTLQPVLFIAKRQIFRNELKMISNLLGSAYLYQSRFDKALEYYFQTYEIALQENDSSYVATGLTILV